MPWPLLETPLAAVQLLTALPTLAPLCERAWWGWALLSEAGGRRESVGGGRAKAWLRGSCVLVLTTRGS